MSWGSPPRTTSETSENTERRSSDSAIVCSRPRRLSIRSRRSVSRSTMELCSKATPEQIDHAVEQGLMFVAERMLLRRRDPHRAVHARALAGRAEDARARVPLVGIDGHALAVNPPSRDRHVALARDDVEHERLRAIEPENVQPLERHPIAQCDRQTRHEVPQARRVGHEPGDDGEHGGSVDDGMVTETHQYNRPFDACFVARIVLYRSRNSSGARTPLRAASFSRAAARPLSIRVRQRVCLHSSSACRSTACDGTTCVTSC